MFLLAGARDRYTKALCITRLADRLPMYENSYTRPWRPPALTLAPRLLTAAARNQASQTPPSVTGGCSAPAIPSAPRSALADPVTTNPISQITSTTKAIHHRMWIAVSQPADEEGRAVERAR